MQKPKSIKKRRKQQREDIIDDILKIARDMMKKEGVGALSFNAIARELGIKPPSLYTYFDSKHAIYDMIFRRGFEQFGQIMNMDDVLDEPIDVVLKQALIRYMQFAQENPDLFQLMFERPIPHFVPSEESMAVSRSVLQKSRESVNQFINHKAINPNLPPDEANDLLIVIMHGLTALHMANHPELPIGEGRFGKIINVAVDLIIKSWTTTDKQ